MADPVQEITYKPIFPSLLGTLKTYIKSKAKDLKFGLANGVSEIPYLLIESISSVMKDDHGLFEPVNGTYYQGEIAIKLFVHENEMYKYYDMLVNLLYGWKAAVGLMDIRIRQRTLYPIKEEMQEYFIYIVAEITYHDYLIDTTFPIISEEECQPSGEGVGYPKEIRVEKIDVTQV